MTYSNNWAFTVGETYQEFKGTVELKNVIFPYGGFV